MSSSDSVPLLRLLSEPLERPRERAAPRPKEPTDGQLVERAVGGDRWAEEALYRRHARGVTNAVLRLIGRDADADDIIQDAFVHAFEKFGALRDGEAFRAWICRIAMNRVRKHMRRRKLARFVGLDAGEDELNFAALAVNGRHEDARICDQAWGPMSMTQYTIGGGRTVPPFDGDIYRVALYDRVLSATEIVCLYLAGHELLP